MRLITYGKSQSLTITLNMYMDKNNLLLVFYILDAAVGIYQSYGDW